MPHSPWEEALSDMGEEIFFPIQQLFLCSVYQQVTSSTVNFSYKAIVTTVTVACTLVLQKNEA